MTLEQIKQIFHERGIRHVKLGVFDIDGVLRGKYVSTEKFYSAAETGMGFCDVIFGWDSSDALYDNVAVTGWHTGYPDAPARIDLSTFRVLPWEKDTALFLLDMELPMAPRNVLRHVEEKARQLGFRAYCSAEYEFFFFRETSASAREKGYRNLTPLSPGMFGYSALRASTHAEFLHQILDSLRDYDVELEGFHTETGPGVYEAAIRYATALKAADKAALFKTAIKEIAARNGLIVTFMAKWNASLPGSSGHIHQSLWDPEGMHNLFLENGGMSETMRHYIGGQTCLMPEVMAMLCPTINSYKRTVPGTWAPVSVSWGVENRTTALRAIVSGEPGGKSTRVEYRLAGADGNPYLAMAAALATGLYGVENHIAPPAPVTGSAYEGNLPPLPRSLAESTARMKASSAVRTLFGDTFVDHFTATREWEVRQFQTAVTNWEMERYFEII